MTTLDPCPCQSEKPFSLCCAPFLSGDTKAQTAESLMRSRYTAYKKRNIEYLLSTWHPSTRPEDIAPETIPDWNSLVIINCESGQHTDTRGVVEFIATAQTQAKLITLHETSNFIKQDGQWFYLDGTIKPQNHTMKKVGRNDPCPCGSGKKYKKCCNR